jgi:hypothetical protein
MTTRLKHYKRVALVGTTIAAIALFLLSAWADLLRFLGLEAFFLVIGAGIGTSFALVIVCVQNVVRPEYLGVATGATTFLRSLGGAMGVSVLGAVFLSYGFAQSTLKKTAYLYIRQSTLRQVFENTESAQRQYALRQRAVALGCLPSVSKLSIPTKANRELRQPSTSLLGTQPLEDLRGAIRKLPQPALDDWLVKIELALWPGSEGLEVGLLARPLCYRLFIEVQLTTDLGKA